MRRRLALAAGWLIVLGVIYLPLIVALAVGLVLTALGR